MKDLDFLTKYINNDSPSQFESSGQKIWSDYVRPYVQRVYDDNYGNVIAVINTDSDFKVVIEAHADEISFLVKRIDDNGYLWVCKNGGVDEKIAPSMKVKVYNTKGDVIPGFFGSKAIHLRESDDKQLKIDDLYIDLGCDSKEEVEKLGIEIGNYVVYDSEFKIYNGNKYVGKSLDDKMGGYVLSQVIKKLKENEDKLPFGLYIVNSVMEEIGLRGAQIVTQHIKPNVAICIDVTHDSSSPGIDKNKVGDFKIGSGLILKQSPAIQKNFLKLIKETATENNIKFKVNPTGGATGTNTDMYTFSNGGVVSALISLPLKYMHTTVECMHEKDVEDCIKLIYQTLKKIQYKQDFRYLKLD